MKKLMISRRRFFKNILYYLAALEFVYLLFRVLKPTKKKANIGALYDAGAVSFFERGKMYPFGAKQFYLHRLKDGGFLAVSSKCTHLGCNIQFNVLHNRFECPCHASAFNTNGEVLSPPATRALDYFPIVFKNNRVLVDINNSTRRNGFNPSQVKYI
jgi:cytochrome b6-f complex iron-sulfur subunit